MQLNTGLLRGADGSDATAPGSERPASLRQAAVSVFALQRTAPAWTMRRSGACSPRWPRGGLACPPSLRPRSWPSWRP